MTIPKTEIFSDRPFTPSPNVVIIWVPSVATALMLDFEAGRCGISESRDTSLRALGASTSVDLVGIGQGMQSRTESAISRGQGSWLSCSHVVAER